MKIYKNLSLLNLDGEIWKTIKEYPEYQVSNLGRVKSFKQDKINGKIRNQQKRRKYLRIYLCKNKKYKSKSVHILVYETFNNYKLKSDECIHHINGDKENNIDHNLIMMPKSEHDNFHKDKKYKNRKLTDEQVIQIKLLLKEGKLNNREIGELFGVKPKTISDIKIGKTWSYIIV